MNTQLEKSPQIPKFAVFLAYAYLFIYYTRIQDNIAGLSAVPWVGILFAIFTLWGIVTVAKGEQKYFSQPIALVFWLGLLFAISGIGSVSPVSYKLSFKWVLQTFPQCVALVVVFSASMERLRSLHNFWCLIYLVLAIFTLKNAPWGAGDFTRDPNDACLALGMGVPYLYYALYQSELSKSRRYFYIVTIFLLLSGIIATSSRGGFLGLVAGCGAIWWMTRNRFKTMMYGLIGALILGGVVMSFIPAKYVSEIESISDSENSTRVQRLRLWEIGWEMFKENPIIGVGADSYKYTVHLYQHKTDWWTGHQTSLSGRSVHSVYFQVIPEIGLIGFGIYAYIMFILPLKLLKLVKRLDETIKEQLQIKLFAQSLIASMAVYVVAGAFISVAYYPHIPIWLVLYTLVIMASKKVELSDASGSTVAKRPNPQLRF